MYFHGFFQVEKAFRCNTNIELVLDFLELTCVSYFRKKRFNVVIN